MDRIAHGSKPRFFEMENSAHRKSSLLSACQFTRLRLFGNCRLQRVRQENFA